jgi:uncharacterized membrane protein
MLIKWLSIAFMLTLVAALFAVLPHLRRRDEFFAVTVLPSFVETPEAKRVLRLYRSRLVGASLMALGGLGLLAALHADQWISLPFLLLVAGQFYATVRANKAVRPFAVAQIGVRVASLQTRRGSLPGGALAWLGPFLILGISALYIASRWSEIPARFPIHWSLGGEPNGWAMRTPLGVFQIALIGAAFCLFILGYAWQGAKQSRGSIAMREYSGRLLLVSSYGIAATFGWLSYRLPLGNGPPGAITIGIIVGSGLLFNAGSVYFGRRAKARADLESTTTDHGISIGDQTPDRRWLGGLIYFNPEDPALFVEQRMGFGYGINFGRPWAWAIVGLLLLIPLAVVVIAHVNQSG